MPLIKEIYTSGRLKHFSSNNNIQYCPWRKLCACNSFSLINYQLKETSVIDANATPPTIGTIEETTQKVGLCTYKDQTEGKNTKNK